MKEPKPASEYFSMFFIEGNNVNDLAESVLKALKIENEKEVLKEATKVTLEQFILNLATAIANKSNSKKDLEYWHKKIIDEILKNPEMNKFIIFEEKKNSN